MEEQPQELAASILIENKNNVWVKDATVTNCLKCNMEFGYLYPRKHHCRNCGNIFCYTCSNYFIVIPEFMTDRPNAADFWNITYYISSLKKPEERVCKKCYDLINEKIKAYDRIVKMFDDPQSIDDIINLSDSNSDIKSYYVDHLRNIQYYLPNHNYSDIDKKLLKINAQHFSGHSKYLVHLIKSMEWNVLFTISNNNNNEVVQSNYDSVELISKIINGEKNKKCGELYCTRTCEEQMSCDDCINILFSCHQTLPDQIIQYLFEIFKGTSKDVILCHLSFFINLIKNNTNKLLSQLIFNLLNQHIKLIYHAYWFLVNSKPDFRHLEDMRHFNNINNFIELIDKETVKNMNREYTFFANLIKNLDNAKSFLADNFNLYKPINLPYDPSIQLTDVDLNSIIVKDSYTKPVIITFQSTDGPIKLLFKKESIMNDVVVLNIMTLCDMILSEILDKNFDVVTYQTMPLTSSSGMIEIVEEAETVYAIKNKCKTILQHIIGKNDYSGRQIPEVLNRYMYSLISYTLQSYFIGLGDRHPQNIMITDDGAIFHIDFGYILGNDTYPITGADIKLNSDMLEVIGGSDSERCQIYLDLCSKGVVLLRKYFNMFFILLSQETKFEQKTIEKFIMSRFQPRQNDAAIINSLMVIIKKSNNAFSNIIRDLLHYTTHETVPNGVGKILRTAFSAFKNLTGHSN